MSRPRDDFRKPPPCLRGAIGWCAMLCCVLMGVPRPTMAGEVVCIPPVTGVYQISGGVTHSTFCQTPPQISFSLLEFVQAGESLTVIGPGVVMTGGIDFQGSPITFAVAGHASVGSCVQNWTLSGAFLDEIPRDRWTGQISISFSGCPCTGLTGNMITATRPDPDCNGNGIHDECDLSCGPPQEGCDVPGCGESEDCNVNCLPDDCDGLANSIFVTWVGTQDDLWSHAANWCPAIVPNNDGAQTFDVLIPNASDVTLDVSPLLERLTLTDASVLNVRAGSGGDRTIEVITGISNQAGTIAARDGRTARIRNSIVVGGALLADAGSRVVLDGSVALAVALTVNGDGRVQLVNDGTLVDAIVQSLEVPDGERGFIEGVVEVQSEGLIKIDAVTRPTSLEPSNSAQAVTLAGGGALLMVENASQPNARAVFGRATLPMTITDAAFSVSGVGRMDALSLDNAGRIAATADAPGRALNLLAFQTDNRGDLFVFDGASMFALGNVDNRDGATVRVEGDGELAVLGTLTLRDGATLGPADPQSAAAELTFGGLVLRESFGPGADPFVPVGSQFMAGGDMSTVVLGPVSASAACMGPLIGGCTPPSVDTFGQSSTEAVDLVLSGADPVTGLQSTYSMRDEATLDLSGSLIVEPGGAFQMQGTALDTRVGNPSAGVGGDVQIGTCGELLTLQGHGPAARRGFQVAGDSDFGPTPQTPVVGGCTPPSVTARGNSGVDVGGSMVMDGVAEVVLEGSLELGGDFQNHLVAAEGFDFTTGRVEMNGAVEQLFEVAGEDRGADPSGFDDNFAVGTLRLDAGVTVRLIDAFANQGGAAVGGTCEALYVDTLVLEPGARLLCDCPVYFIHVMNDGGDLCAGAVPIGTCHTDCDDDGDVDLVDFAQLYACIQLTPTSIECRSCFDCNGDGFVGLADFGSFQRAFTGPLQ